MEKWVYFDEIPFVDSYGLDLFKQGDTFKEGENLYFNDDRDYVKLLVPRSTYVRFIEMSFKQFNKLFVSEVDYKTFNPAWLKFKKEHTYERFPF